MVQIIRVSNDPYNLHTFRITSNGHQIILGKMQENYSTWFLFSWCSAAMSLAFSVTLSKKSPALP